MSESEDEQLEAGRARRDREALLAKAGMVVARRGAERTRFSDVAEATGTSVSTLQYLYNTRDFLVREALRVSAGRLLAEARTASDEIADPVARLRCVSHHLAGSSADAESARWESQLWVEYWRASLRDRDLSTETTQAYDGWVSLVGSAIDYAVSQGVAGPVIDVVCVAQAACAMADGFAIQIGIGRPGASWSLAQRMTQAWLGWAINCPALSDHL